MTDGVVPDGEDPESLGDVSDAEGDVPSAGGGDVNVPTGTRIILSSGL